MRKRFTSRRDARFAFGIDGKRPRTKSNEDWTNAQAFHPWRARPISSLSKIDQTQQIHGRTQSRRVRSEQPISNRGLQDKPYLSLQTM